MKSSYKEQRNPHDGLWDIPLPRPPSTKDSDSDTKHTPILRYNHHTSHANVILRYDQDKHDLVAFLHAACFAPVKSTFLKAINNNHFTTWPGLTAKLVSKHLQEPTSTALGHIKQEFQGLRSTKQRTNLESLPSNEDMFPTQL